MGEIVKEFRGYILAETTHRGLTLCRKEVCDLNIPESDKTTLLEYIRVRSANI